MAPVRSSGPRSLLAVSCAVILAHGCRGDNGLAPVSVRDSAGIRIVENGVPAWRGAGWRVDTVPQVRIGGAELNEPHTAIRLAGGQIVVADLGDAALHVFDELGTPVTTIGRSGRGPGEFSYPSLIRAMAGDSILVYDRALLRFSVFDGSGTFHRSYQLPVSAELPTPWVITLFANRDALVLGPWFGPSDRQTEGARRDEGPLFRWSHADSSYHVLEVHWTSEQYYAPFGNGLLPIPIPFTGSSEFAVSSVTLLAGYTRVWELKALGERGDLEAVFRIARPARSVTAAHRTTAYDHLRGRSRRADIRATVARALDRLPAPATLPAFGRWVWERVPSRDPDRPAILVDAEGHIWVVEYQPPAEARAWDVLTPEGRWLGAVVLPPGVEPLEIGADYVLGWRMDDLDVVTIELYRLYRW